MARCAHRFEMSLQIPINWCVDLFSSPFHSVIIAIDLLSYLPAILTPTASYIISLSRMLQQNNNNNHPCLEMTHSELIHDIRRPSVSFTSALEFGAIPLIKGLRAWAVSGGYSKARRKAAAGLRAKGTYQEPPENRVGQRICSGQVSSSYGQTLENTASTTRTPWVRQGGLGALVTVATLKGTEGGGRQTQTRCLFLKAQERGNYICTVENRGAGMRVTGARTRAVILEGIREEVRCRGPRVSQDKTDESGTLKAKPRAIKWRKCSNSTGTVGKKTNKGKINISPCEPDRDDNTVISEELINRTSDDQTTDRITECQKEENKMTGDKTRHPGVTKQKEPTELNKEKRAHIPILMHVVESMDTGCSSAGLYANTGEMNRSPSKICLENCERSRCAYEDAQKETENHKCDDLHANNYQNIKRTNKDRNLIAHVPNLEGLSASGFKIKRSTPNCNTEPSVGRSLTSASSEGHTNMKKNQDQESGTDGYLLNCENQHSLKNVTNASHRVGTSDSSTGHTCTPERVLCNTAEKNWKLLMCSPQQWQEFLSDEEKHEVKQFNKSSLQGFGTPTADETVTSNQSKCNTAPTTIVREVRAQSGDLLALVNSKEFPSEPKGAEEGDKVATSEGSLQLVDGEEDEFGAFMQADEEQLWTDGFTEHQPLASRDECNSGNLKSCTDTNESTSCQFDWMSVHSFQQSESTWVAFSQESVEQKKEPDGQWWLEKTNMSLSDVSGVFLEAFPSENPSCESSEDIPTLTQLLQGPDGNGTTGEHGEKNLLDGLQDLDRMISLKYKRTESLSCKLLLLSLHMQCPSSEVVTVRVKGGARFSPNLLTSNQQLAANAERRRLSYDFNRNIMP